MKISVDFELPLPESREYTPTEETARDFRDEIEYLLHAFFHGHKQEHCAKKLNCILKKLKARNAKPRPLRWMQELETEIADALHSEGMLHA